MTTIYKYPIGRTDQQIVAMPQGARILTAQVQDQQLCLWAEVDPALAKEPRTICIVGTGHAIPAGPLLYLTSVLDGPFVWHVYERARDERVS